LTAAWTKQRPRRVFIRVFRTHRQSVLEPRCGREGRAAAAPVHPWHRRRPVAPDLLLGLSGAIQAARRAPRSSSRQEQLVGGRTGPASGKPWTRPPSPLGARTHFARTPRQRGNRVVTNKQFVHWSYALGLVPARLELMSMSDSVDEAKNRLAWSRDARTSWWPKCLPVTSRRFLFNGSGDIMEQNSQAGWPPTPPRSGKSQGMLTADGNSGNSCGSRSLRKSCCGNEMEWFVVWMTWRHERAKSCFPADLKLATTSSAKI